MVVVWALCLSDEVQKMDFRTDGVLLLYEQIKIAGDNPKRRNI